MSSGDDDDLAFALALAAQQGRQSGGGGGGMHSAGGSESGDDDDDADATHADADESEDAPKDAAAPQATTSNSTNKRRRRRRRAPVGAGVAGGAGSGAGGGGGDDAAKGGGGGGGGDDAFSPTMDEEADAEPATAAHVAFVESLRLNNSGYPQLHALATQSRAAWPAHDRFPAQALLLESHDTFRETLRRVLQAVAATERCGDARLKAAAGKFGSLGSSLHAHHGYEDDKLYPFLCSKYSVTFKHLDTDHGLLDRRITEVSDAFSACLRSKGQNKRGKDETLLRALRARLSAFRGLLLRHLRDEETVVIPMLLELTPREFATYYDAPDYHEALERLGISDVTLEDEGNKEEGAAAARVTAQSEVLSSATSF